MRKRLLACAVALALALGTVPLPAVAYAEPNSAVVMIEVEKQLEGAAPTSAEEYAFALEAVDGAPMPDESIVNIIGEGTVHFPEIVFTAPGTYRYTVSELAGQSEGCVYDDAEYDVTVQVVTDDKGSLSTAFWASKRGEEAKADEILFVNRYDDSEEEPPSSGESGSTPGLFPKTGDFGLWVFTALSALAVIALLTCVACIARRRKGGR